MHNQLRRSGWFFETPGGGGGGGGGGDDGKKAYSQAELDAMFGERAKRAGEAATKQLLEALGVKDADELRTKLDSAKKAEERELTEKQRLEREAAEARTRADQAEKDRDAKLAAAQKTALRAAVKAEAVKQGFDDAELKTVWLELEGDAETLKTIKAKDDGEYDGLEAAIKAIAAAHPKWLKTAAGGQGNINANSRGGGSTPTQEELIRRKKAGSQYSGI